MTKLVEAIGVSAMLEQTAEEATELAFACLKYARYLRGENKVHNRTKEELLDNLEEEIADTIHCFQHLEDSDIVDSDNIVNFHLARKIERMEKRLEENVK